jgi:hypothetical protein
MPCGSTYDDARRLRAIADAANGSELDAVLDRIGADHLERLGIENQLGDIPGEAQREARAILERGL